MKKFLIILLVYSLWSIVRGEESIYAQGDMANYLILEDIGGYKFRPKPTKRLYGNSGILAATGHFYMDHDDITYETRYILPEPLSGAEVQVTQHAGSDSDRWLLHEVERGFRRGDYEENMTPARFRNIDGNNIFYSGLGGGTYRWLSNKVVVSIEYVDLYKQKPEPLEVVRAYLAKFPSTIPAITRDRAYNEKWIKDEMERRLWLSDKWFMALESGKAEQSKVIKEEVDHMVVFLDYREKYYGISASDEKKLLWKYLEAKDVTSIKTKLTEYKNWWNANKGNPLQNVLGN